MLRLEKSKSSGREVAINVSDSDPFLSPRFKRALAVAVAVHLLAFLAVSVESAPTPSLLPSPSVVVEMPHTGRVEAAKEAEKQAAFQRIGGLSTYLLASHKQSPALPSLPDSKLERYVPLFEKEEKLGKVFEILERSPLSLEGAGFSFLTSHRPVRQELFGGLARLEVMEKGLGALEGVQPRLEESQSHRVALEVHVDHRSGECMRSEVRLSSGIPHLDQVAQSIAKEMRFAPLKKGVVTSGQMELTFSLSEVMDTERLAQMQKRSFSR